MTERFRGSHSHYLVSSGISVCRIARRDSRSCVTIPRTVKIIDSKLEENENTRPSDGSRDSRPCDF